MAERTPGSGLQGVYVGKEVRGTETLHFTPKSFKKFVFGVQFY